MFKYLFFIWFAYSPFTLMSFGNIVIATNYCDGTPLHFSYNDYYVDLIQSRDIKKIGSWRTIHSEEPILIIFSKDWIQYPVLAYPGDTISLDCTKQKIVFVGNRSFEELNALSLIESKVGFLLPSLGGIQISKRTNLKYLASVFDSLHARRLAIIDSLFIAKDKGAYLSMKNMITYHMAVDHLRPYTWKFEELSLNDIPIKYKESCDSLSRFVKLGGSPREMKLGIFLISFAKYLIRDSLRTQDPILNNSGIFYHSVKRVYTGEALNLVLFLAIKQGLIDSEDFVIDFRKSCDNAKYVSYIDSLLELRTGLVTRKQNINTQIESITNTNLHFGELINSSKGTAIYIDFWASWCGPCIDEIPTLKSLSGKFNGKLTVLSISIDRDKEKWIAALRKYALSDSQFRMKQYSPVGEYIGLTSVPRYILIDKKGKVVSLNAPRPSEAGLLLPMLEKAIRE